jgi:cation-transporting ATPase E
MIPEGPSVLDGHTRSPDAAIGLSAADVEARVLSGRTNAAPSEATRTVAQILRANVLTRFNAILIALFVVILVVGPIQDSLFGAVIIVNTAFGVVQELRAKRTLDRLALMSAPHTLVVREGSVLEVALDEVVQDDVLEICAGDQLVVDGKVLTGEVEVDESLLSGEAEPVPKAAGDELLSGSFVVSGTARCSATRVGADSYAQRLTAEARRFSLVHSELQSGTNAILRGITWAIAPVAILLVASQATRDKGDLADAVRGTVAGVGSMVPEGLVLLTSLAFAVAVLRLARRKVLVQELASVEGLARVDTICLDKTGTLTRGSMSFDGLELLDTAQPADEALASLARADPNPNASMRAIAEAFKDRGGWRATGAAPFSSARKWGGASFAGQGAWILGAPEVVAPEPSVVARADALAAEGKRVLVLARVPGQGLAGDQRLPAGLEPVALVMLAEDMRPAADRTIAYFVSQGVEVKVISGDHPMTAAAVARAAGVPRADRAVDGRALPEEGPALAQAMAASAVFGRVGPHQKRAMVAALQSSGRTVAMTGDGVNDVLALKDADIGVAMGSGSAASRAVSQLILLGGSFDVLPGVVAEGRRVIANVERVASLFVTKTIYATLIGLVAGAMREPYPFLPRHLTVVSTLTIGLPALVLALAPNTARYRPGFVRRTLEFSLPAGIVAGAVALAAYALARSQRGLGLEQARSTATIALFAEGLWVLMILMRPYRCWKLALAALVTAAFAGSFVVAPVSRILSLTAPPTSVLLGALAMAAVGGVLLEAAQPVVRAAWARGPTRG